MDERIELETYEIDNAITIDDEKLYVKIPHTLIESKTIKHIERHIYVILKNSYDEKKRKYYITNGELKKFTGIADNRTIKNSLKSLQEKQLLTVATDLQRLNESTKITVTFPKLTSSFEMVDIEALDKVVTSTFHLGAGVVSTAISVFLLLWKNYQGCYPINCVALTQNDIKQLINIDSNKLSQIYKTFEDNSIIIPLRKNEFNKKNNIRKRNEYTLLNVEKYKKFS